jgi:signal peptide peptidase SppA
MTTHNRAILARFDRQPSLVSPQHASQLQTVTVENDEEENAVFQHCARLYGFDLDEEEDRKPFVYKDGVAFIPVYGILLHRFGWASSYATGYDFIRSQFQLALNDPDVKGIVLDVNSYGGQVSGNFELADEIYAGRAAKPVLAVVDASAYSGGYSLASAAERVVVTPSAGVGSIGVVMMHVSFEKMLTEAGIEVTFIYAGKHKIDGNPYKDLSKDAEARFQTSVDRSYQKFVSLVARNRGMEASKVKATEALCYDAEEAMGLGLIDAIQTPQDALAAFRTGLKTRAVTNNRGVSKMSNSNDNGGDQTVSKTEHEAAVAKAATDAAQGAVKAERERFAAITTSAEAKGREDLANYFATKTAMSSEEAIAALAAAPKVAAAPADANATKRNDFAAHMDRTEQPNIEATGGGGDNDDQPKSRGSRIVDSYAAATGLKLVQGDKK